MPWWSWIVIWIALVALSLLFFGVLGVRLFRQFMATLKELGEAAERFSTCLHRRAPAPLQRPTPAGAGAAGSADQPSAGARRRRFCLARPDAT